MILKQKLAHDYSKRRTTTGHKTLDEALREQAEWAFLAGFEKALELALHCIMTGNPVDLLGEEEIDSDGKDH